MSRVCVLLLILIGSCSSPQPAARSNYGSAGTAATMHSMLGDSGTQEALIATFAQNAASGNIDALVNLFSETPIRATGQETLRATLREGAVPFFSRMQKLDGYSHINGARFEDGSTGIIHYTYIQTTTGTYEPFTIAIRQEGDSLKVMNIAVGGCVKGRHPVSEGRCAK